MQDWSVFTLIYWYFYLSKGPEYFFHHCNQVNVYIIKQMCAQEDMLQESDTNIMLKVYN